MGMNKKVMHISKQWFQREKAHWQLEKNGLKSVNHNPKYDLLNPQK